MTVVDTINRIFREFKRYTGDGLPSEPTGAALPVGDPQSGPYSPKKSELRSAFAEILGAAAADAEAAAAALAEFERLYLGAKAADPSTDNEGNALEAGALYFSTTGGKFRVWTGSIWQDQSTALTDGQVTEPKLADGAVTLIKLGADAVAKFGVVHVSSRAALADLAVNAQSLADLTESGRAGRFVLRLVSSLSTAEAAGRTADTEQGVFVNSTANALYVWQRVHSGALNVHWFGVPGALADITRAQTYSRLDNCWYVALALSLDIYFPAGIYDCGDDNFPFREKNLSASALLDCNYITVKGDGPNTILQTTSSAGADVVQAFALKNITFRDFRIKSDLTGFAGAGSNGVSIVGGFDNLEFLDLHIGPLRSVDKTTYIDGGKALTFQSEGTTNICGRVKARYSAIFCAQAFGFESNLVNMQSKKVSIDIDVMAERCGTGVLFVAAAATGAVPSGFQTGIKIKAHLTNCQQSVILNRAHGIDVDATAVDNAGAASLKATDFWGNFYNASAQGVTGLMATYAKNSRVKFVGDVGLCQYGAVIGATSPGSSGQTGNTQFCEFDLDFTCTPSVSYFNDPQVSGAAVTSSRINIAGGTITSLSQIPATWTAAASANIVYSATATVVT